MATLVRRLGAIVCLAAALSVLLLGMQVLMAYTGGINLVIRGPGAALFVVAAFALFLATMIAFGLLLRLRHSAPGLMWGAFGLAGAPVPLAAYAVALGDDDAHDPLFRLLLYGLLAGYALYAAAIVAFGRRLSGRRDLPRSLKAAGLLFSAGGGFYLAHAAIAALATLQDGYVFPRAALFLMVAGGGLVALAEAAIALSMWRKVRDAAGAVRPGLSA